MRRSLAVPVERRTGTTVGHLGLDATGSRPELLRSGLEVPPRQTFAVYRAILPTGDIACVDYDRQDRGVELYDDDGHTIAFVPYDNLVALVDEEATMAEDRSAM